MCNVKYANWSFYKIINSINKWKNKYGKYWFKYFVCCQVFITLKVCVQRIYSTEMYQFRIDLSTNLFRVFEKCHVIKLNGEFIKQRTTG